ncbi:hypothetical protein [Methylobacterium sp. P1-11]|uniref:hypothetical protein n=1 Tax=Methylobacterium sp. P1-11 TaxID=2024616 RepID=UPI0011ECC23B|nr:hypothetical protein [Methylobacterium sp. P1-11]
MSKDRFRIWLLESKSPNWIGDNYAIQPEDVTADALRQHIRAQGGEPSDLRISLVEGEPLDRSGAHRHAFNLAEKHGRLVTPLWPAPPALEIAGWKSGICPERIEGTEG